MKRLPKNAALKFALTSALCVSSLLFVGAAAAQPPDLRLMAGRPLPVADLPAGSVSIRVARKLPANAAAGIEVVATITASGSEAKTIKAVTGPDGRAMFSNLPAGASFQAVAVVDGESLQTQPFPIPASGGVRSMLISALPAGPAPGAQGAGEEGGGAPEQGNSRFAFSVTVAAPVPAADIPAGTLEVSVVDSKGKPIANHDVNVGQAGADGKVQAFDQKTDASGVARFVALSTAQDIGFLVVTEIEGMRIGTKPFRMATDGGMRAARMAPPARTADKSVLNLDQGSRFIFEVREDYLFVGEVLSFRNDTDRIFDGGPKGIFIPLPHEMTSFQAMGDGATVEEIKSKGLLMRAEVPPTGPTNRGVQARFAFLLPTYGDDALEFEQTLDVPMKTPLVIVPDVYKLTLQAEGLRTLQKEKDSAGNSVSLYELGDIPAGGKVKIRISGLPKVDKTGHIIAVVVSSLLFCWAVWGVLGARVGKGGKEEKEKLSRKFRDLRNRREKLFEELVALERRRRSGGNVDDSRREQLVSQLESVYRDLQADDAGASHQA